MRLSPSLAVVSLLALSAPARAEVGAASAPPETPPPAATAPAPVAAPDPAAPAVPPPEAYLTYDAAKGEVFLGPRALTRSEVFATLGRPDLEEVSRRAAKRRVALAVAAGGAVVLGVAIGTVALSMRPDLNSSYCTQSFHYYNDICAASYHRDDTVGTVAIGSGLLAGLVLGGFAYFSSPDVLTGAELKSAVAKHNVDLWTQRQEARRARPVPRFLPYATPQGGGLMAQLDF